ncbi:cyclin-like protein [Diplodia corticola]|uniref:Cyclin-like protein n=1 Tax=Diplodia corticola TaxID=236234 RepID=A0A1J9R2H1_9PEZI|nr:cyclin-like protein [Diplodia corticola]OJD34442.1 cyclin-like protein [Diplodia corticola]
MESPPLSVGSRRGSVDSEDYDDYLANYVPLSNLPTPPPAQAGASWSEAPRSLAGHLVDENDLRGPASHLAKLVPSNACSRRPSVSVIEDYLERSNLPFEVLGLTACILDALSMRFAKKWRHALTLNEPTPAASPLLDAANGPISPPASPALMTAAPVLNPAIKSHAEPELLVLSALALATGYLDDHQVSLQHWAQRISCGVFSARELSTTQRCVLIDLDYDLHSFTLEFIRDSIEDMHRASLQSRRNAAAAAAAAATTTVAVVKDVAEEPYAATGEKNRPAPLSLQGSATWFKGIATPEPSPSVMALDHAWD